MNTEKAALRAQYKKKIEELPADYIAESDAGIFENLVRLPEFEKAGTIFTYYSMGRESDTRKIVDFALQQGKIVTLPVCLGRGIMEAHAIGSPSDLSLTSYGLLEPNSSTRVIAPEALDFIIVPALAYDLGGFRLGYGGGYYDRFLLRTPAFTAGIGRERLLAESVPREAHDVPVHYVVTERKARLRSGVSQS